jgi:hypothetical protein
MKNEQVISKAKEYAREFIGHMPIDSKLIDGSAKLTDAVVIYFGDGPDPILTVILDKETGNFVSATSPN